MAKGVRLLKTNHPKVPWQVVIPVRVTGTRRVRHSFANREKALAYLIRIKAEGFVHVESQSQASGGKPTISECAALWIARHQQARLGHSQIKIVINRLAAQFGHAAVESIDHRMLDTWLRSLENFSPVYVHNHWRIVRRFFNFCRDFLEVIPRNPMAKLKERRLEHRDPEILTPEQMRACLEAAGGDRRMLAFLCLGGFAGMRTTEILRQTWEDIDWQHGEIFVRQPKRVGGWRPRHVEILPALRRHLEPVALQEGAVIPGGMRTLYLSRRAMMDKLGWGSWPDNCLRHSFKSYHYAAFGSNEKTAQQLGHAGGVSFYIYGSPVVKAAAASWWGL